MEYNLTDERVQIENLQKMLRFLWLVTGEEAYEVGVSGVYGEGTEQAVRAFQQKNGLPVTGVVDLATWNRISTEYERLRFLGESPLGIRPFPTDRDAVVPGGERSDLVYILQIMLNTLDVLYDFGYVPISGYYDRGTAEAVRKFQEINGLANRSGTVDRMTWNALAEEFNNALSYD